VLGFGNEIVGPVAQIDKALSLARSAELDAAILDIDVDGAVIFPVADMLGYESPGLPARFRDNATLQNRCGRDGHCIGEAPASSAPQPPWQTVPEGNYRNRLAGLVPDPKRLTGHILVFHDPVGNDIPGSLGGFRDGRVEISELQAVRVLVDQGSINDIEVEARHAYKQQARGNGCTPWKSPRGRLT
jgi:hypothetical protein